MSRGTDSSESVVKAKSNRSTAVHGVAWNLSNSALAFVMQMLRAVILARLLSTEDFGVLGKSIGALFVASLISSFSFGIAIVQTKVLRKETVETSFTTQFFLGLLVFLFSFFVAPSYGVYYGENELGSILPVLGFGLWVNSVAVVPVALLQRKLDFKTLNVVWFFQRLLSFISAVVFALMGLNFWALILPDVIWACFSLPFLFWRLGWLPAFAFDFKSLIPVLEVTKRSTVSGWLAIANGNIDYAILGMFFPSSILGIYLFGFRRIREPMRVAVASVRSVLFPAFARVKNDVSLRSVMMDSISVLTVCVYSIAGFIYMSLPSVIVPVFGLEWAEATPIMRIFLIWALYLPFNLVLSAGQLARGEFGPEIKSGIVRFCLICPGLVYLCLDGYSVLSCACWIAVAEVISGLLFTIICLRRFKISMIALFRVISCPLIALMLCLVVGTGGVLLSDRYNLLHSAQMILVQAVVFGFVFFSVIYLFDREAVSRFSEVFSLFRKTGRTSN